MYYAVVTIQHLDIECDHFAEWSDMEDGHGPHHARHANGEDGREHGFGVGFDLHEPRHEIPDRDALNFEGPAGPQPEAIAPPNTSTFLNTSNWTYFRDL